MARIELASLGTGVAQSSNGVVVPNAPGTIYAHNTLTPVTVYADEAGSNPNGSGRFSTDAFGRIPGWIDLGQTVDVTISPAPTITVDVNFGGDVAAETTRALAAEAQLVPLSQKGAANGVGTLDGSNRQPIGQSPVAAVSARSTGGVIPWATGLVIPINQLVSNAGSTYLCKTAHTAGGSFDASKFDSVGSSAPVNWCVFTLPGLPAMTVAHPYSFPVDASGILIWGQSGSDFSVGTDINGALGIISAAGGRFQATFIIKSYPTATLDPGSSVQRWVTWAADLGPSDGSEVVQIIGIDTVTPVLPGLILASATATSSIGYSPPGTCALIAPAAQFINPFGSDHLPGDAGFAEGVVWQV